MERRREFRYSTNQDARIVLLGEPDRLLKGYIQNISGRGMQLVAEEPVSPGQAVRVEWDDLLALGEATYCQPEADGNFSFGLHLEQTLTNLDELARLWATLSEESSERVPSNT